MSRTGTVGGNKGKCLQVQWECRRKQTDFQTEEQFLTFMKMTETGILDLEIRKAILKLFQKMKSIKERKTENLKKLEKDHSNKK